MKLGLLLNVLIPWRSLAVKRFAAASVGPVNVFPICEINSHTFAETGKKRGKLSRGQADELE
jgi:hypothetical protein